MEICRIDMDFWRSGRRSVQNSPLALDFSGALYENTQEGFSVTAYC